MEQPLHHVIRLSMKTKVHHFRNKCKPEGMLQAMWVPVAMWVSSHGHCYWPSKSPWPCEFDRSDMSITAFKGLQGVGAIWVLGSREAMTWMLRNRHKWPQDLLGHEQGRLSCTIQCTNVGLINHILSLHSTSSTSPHYVAGWCWFPNVLHCQDVEADCLDVLIISNMGI